MLSGIRVMRLAWLLGAAAAKAVLEGAMEAFSGGGEQRAGETAEGGFSKPPGGSRKCVASLYQLRSW